MIALYRSDRPEGLPPWTADLWAAGAAESLFFSAPWFGLVMAHGMRPGATPLFLALGGQDEAIALLALARDGNKTARGLETPYSCRYAPLIAPTAAPEHIATLVHALRDFAAVRLDALDPAAPSTSALRQAARQAGLLVVAFDHFGTWHEPVAGLSWARYLAARPGPLRSTVRRKLARMARAGGSLEIVTDPARLEPAIAAYEAVYQRSWKAAEPFPTFNAALMRLLAPLGKLRLGLYRIDGQPVAAQLWLVEHGTASVLKLAHDAAFRDASPGTVLTALMLRRLLDEEQVTDIDFGRGDDAYKRLWASQRRQMIGLLLINPRQPRGLALFARHQAGALWRRLRKTQFGYRESLA